MDEPRLSADRLAALLAKRGKQLPQSAAGVAHSARPHPERSQVTAAASFAGEERVNEARDRIAPLMHELVERGKSQGSVRDDFEQTDIIFMQVGLSAIMDSSRAIEPDLYLRYLTIFLDGIRTDRAEFTPLPKVDPREFQIVP